MYDVITVRKHGRKCLNANISQHFKSVGIKLVNSKSWHELLQWMEATQLV